MATRIQLLAASGAAVLLLLAGCATAPEAGSGEPTLVETKAQVQLLRNEATGRIDPAIVADVRKTGDQSFPCYTEAENPGGLIRQWHSSAEVVLVDGADRVAASAALVESFVAEGWEADEVSDDADFGQTDLTKSGSVASITVSSADQSVIAIIRVLTTGPCVTTDGPDSDEVRGLE